MIKLGLRKYSFAILCLIVFSVAIFVNPQINVLDLGIGLSTLMATFGGANVGTHFAEAMKLKNSIQQSEQKQGEQQ